MSRSLLIMALAAALSLVLTACGGTKGEDGQGRAPAGARPTGEKADDAKSKEPQSFTGTLRGGIVAGGGETTGWVLEGDGAVGGLDVDVSKVRKQAEKFDGKRVQVRGRMTEKDWPERGKTPVLAADSIEAAEEKKEQDGTGGDDAGGQGEGGEAKQTRL